ncbi:hypothetical protein [Bradyrhizobium canariense]|uniref:Uncharacterized protein n=1 Tax=Bradyrhizobium canariense TaxID=255045 RepID=A0A1H1YPP9_9BRAD|nr:hypothetical protein [Bradyrhizobium canariense]SDT23414.1 hypothetical protein SAMN05444158_4946 [Bradyrhizobium canariense]
MCGIIASTEGRTNIGISDEQPNNIFSVLSLTNLFLGSDRSWGIFCRPSRDLARFLYVPIVKKVNDATFGEKEGNAVREKIVSLNRFKGHMSAISLVALCVLSSTTVVSASGNKLVAEVDDVCAPIGRTEDGKLIYSLKCTIIPKVDSQNEQLGSEQVEKNTQSHGGLFGWSLQNRQDEPGARPAIPPSPN